MGLHNLENYEIVVSENIDDIKAKGTILKHKKTGARVVCLENDDPNKVFYIGFRTPPTDSTGVPHIIEHSVLCGSTKYPAKDPFVELAKGSLNTFLNAMTYPDKTVYPVASCNDADFRNLMDVYLDAVFHTNIYTRPQIFKQEGWHYELDSAYGDVTLNGVVYNEMKGVYSSPDDIFDRAVIDSLFPDNCYGVESGGDPDVIPSLAYEDFLDFHGRYYHPSNSYIYLYGNVDMEASLRYIDEEYLCKYDELSIDSTVKRQEAFDEVNFVKLSYSITNDEPLENNSYMAYNGVIDTSLDEKLYLSFQVLDYALVGAPGAVLKQALLDKGICKDVQSCYETDIYQPYFSVIIKNANEQDKEVFVDTVREVLTKVVSEGFDKKALLAGINLFEFKFREADFGHYPKGLMYGLQILDSWIYDDSKPFIHLKALDTFTFLRENIQTGYFEELVQQYLIDNNHRSVVIMTPERGLNAVKDKELFDKLAEYKNSLSDEEIEALIKDTQELHKYQEEEDTPEVLATIPLLKISDIKKEAEPLIINTVNKDDLLFVTHDVFTNGIGYLTIHFDITNIPEEYLPYLGILKAVIGGMNTKNYTYADLANEVFINSGGISYGTSMYADVNESEKFTYVFEAKAKVLYERLDFAYDMISEVLLTTDFSDKKRLYELICMIKSRLQAAMMSSGHVISSHRALSHVSKTEAISEKTSGIEFYRVIEEIESDFDNKADELIDMLTGLAQNIFVRSKLKLQDYTSTADQIESFTKLGKDFADKLKNTDSDWTGFDFVPSVVNEGFKTGGKIQYVSKAGKYLDKNHPYTGALKVLKVIMGYDYLWNNVRVIGGAYGAFAMFTRSGKGYFSSYRDPNLKRTLDIYSGAVNYLENFNANDRDMTKYIIGTISDMDVPLTPSAKGERSLGAFISNDTIEGIQKERDEVICADVTRIRELAGYIRNMAENESVCVVGGEEIIESEKAIFNKTEPLFLK